MTYPFKNFVEREKKLSKSHLNSRDTNIAVEMYSKALGCPFAIEIIIRVCSDLASSSLLPAKTDSKSFNWTIKLEGKGGVKGINSIGLLPEIVCGSSKKSASKVDQKLGIL